MHVLVTGAAGFIGSHTVDRLLEQGHSVVGIDSFEPYYDLTAKHSNLLAAMTHPSFRLETLDLVTDSGRVEALVAEADAVVHLAGQPGVRGSWGNAFERYVHNNVMATKVLLEAAHSVGISRFVYASSSSVYGQLDGAGPAKESFLPRPHSPYGITKLAAEHLCSVYAENFQVPVVSLRYFSVYGPRQRPDMAFAQIASAMRNGATFKLFGSGDHIRDFTFVDDVVEANLRALEADAPPGLVCNIAGGSIISMTEVLATVMTLYPDRLRYEMTSAVAGDVHRTEADTTRAREFLAWAPRVDLAQGLRRQLIEGLADADARTA